MRTPISRLFCLYSCLCLCLSLVLVESATAQNDAAPVAATSLLQDFNGDGLITVAAFGDSITRGEGDFTSPNSKIYEAEDPSTAEAGYPLRIESYLGIGVSNWGSSGEVLTQGAVQRFIDLVSENRPDVAIIVEGSNDGRFAAQPHQVYRALQTMINVSQAVGTTPVLSTIIPPCCGHGFLGRFIDSYNPQIRLLSVVNEVRMADPDRAFRSTCNISNCRLLCRPEGLHPNIDGYEVLGEAIISTLLGIDLFSTSGRELYAQALGIDPAAIETEPEPVVPVSTPIP